MKKFTLVIAGVVILMIPNCTKDVYTPDICFQEDVLPIFVSNCSMSGCHDGNGEGDYNLTNYDGIMRGITPGHPMQSEIYLSIRGAYPSMPQGGQLSRKDISTIKNWIRAGAQNTSNCRTCDTVTFTYSGRINPVLQSWCVGCHHAGNAGGGFDLSNYNGVVSAIAGNKLMGSIKHLSGFVAMPKNAGSLSQCDIDAFQKWVDAGYPNN